MNSLVAASDIHSAAQGPLTTARAAPNQITLRSLFSLLGTALSQAPSRTPAMDCTSAQLAKEMTQDHSARNPSLIGSRRDFLESCGKALAAANLVITPDAALAAAQNLLEAAPQARDTILALVTFSNSNGNNVASAYHMLGTMGARIEELAKTTSPTTASNVDFNSYIAGVLGYLQNTLREARWIPSFAALAHVQTLSLSADEIHWLSDQKVGKQFLAGKRALTLAQVEALPTGRRQAYLQDALACAQLCISAILEHRDRIGSYVAAAEALYGSSYCTRLFAALGRGCWEELRDDEVLPRLNRYWELWEERLVGFPSTRVQRESELKSLEETLELHGERFCDDHEWTLRRSQRGVRLRLDALTERVWQGEGYHAPLPQRAHINELVQHHNHLQEQIKNLCHQRYWGQRDTPERG